MKNYIFGYGSLIEKESRRRTTPNAEIAFPVRIFGFMRGWFGRTPVSGLSTTFLGCIKTRIDPQNENQKNYVNGVIYEVSNDELLATDEREQGYKRIRVDFDNVLDFSGKVEGEFNIWIYINHFSNDLTLDENLPSKDFPIVQSYVDICINGCLEIESLYPKAKESKFAVDFINTTHFWSKYWVNDRIYPRRPFIYRPNAYKIDQILKENLPDKNLFNQIYFE